MGKPSIPTADLVAMLKKAVSGAPSYAPLWRFLKGTRKQLAGKVPDRQSDSTVRAICHNYYPLHL